MASNFWASSHCNHWLLDPQTILHSRALDLQYCNPRQLASIHIFFANVLQKLGKRLALRQVPIATATVFFKRFYLKSGFCETDPFLVAAACIYVAAKVEETPVHIKSVVSESRHCFNEYSVKSFPADYTKLAEMEFYLLSDLDFHFTVFHPYRSLGAICGREPIDSGEFPNEETEGAGMGDGLDVDDDMGVFGESAVNGNTKKQGAEEAERVNKMFGKGSGKEVGYIEDAVLQMAWFIVNDTYRTDIPLLYPPYIIALAALYLSFIITEKAGPPAQPQANQPLTNANLSAAQQAQSRPGSRGGSGLPSPTVSSPTAPYPSSQGQALALAQGRRIIGRAQAAELFSSFNISIPTLLRIVQEIIAIYPVWEELDTGMVGGSSAGPPTSALRLAASQGQPGAASAAALAAGYPNPALPEKERGLKENEVVNFLLKMREGRWVDQSHPEDGGAESANAGNVGGVGVGVVGGQLRGTKRARP